MTLHLRIRPSRRSGFTLVELLVVIAIVSVLATLAIIGVQKGLKSAAAGKTQNHMKNIHAILMDVVSEGTETGYHDPGSFPPHSGILGDDQGTSFVWWDLIAEKAEIASRDGGRFEWDVPYWKTILHNPLSKEKLGGDSTEYYSLVSRSNKSRGGFAYNGELGGRAGASDDEEQAFVIRSSKVKDESNTIVFAESDDEDTGEGWVFDSVQECPKGNYKDRVFCCFIDGHVEHIKNEVIRKNAVFNFYTSVEDKNYDNQP